MGLGQGKSVMTVKGAVVVAGLLAAGLVGGVLGAAGPVMAQAEVPVEVGTLGASEVALHIHPFLSDEELTALRLVATNEQALALFVPDASKGHSAMAASPDDGVFRDGKPVASAMALAGLPDAATARTNALAACDKARSGKAACVVVLEVAPAP